MANALLSCRVRNQVLPTPQTLLDVAAKAPAAGGAESPRESDPSTKLRVDLRLSKVERGWGPASKKKKICVAIPAGRRRIGEVAKADLMSGEQQDGDGATDEEG